MCDGSNPAQPSPTAKKLRIRPGVCVALLGFVSGHAFRRAVKLVPTGPFKGGLSLCKTPNKSDQSDEDPSDEVNVE